MKYKGFGKIILRTCIDTQQQVAVHIYGFVSVQKVNYIGGKPIRRTGVDAAGKNEVTGEMVKCGGDIVVDWIWRLCDVIFERGVVPEDWRFAVIVPLHGGKGEKLECSR